MSQINNLRTALFLQLFVAFELCTGVPVSNAGKNDSSRSLPITIDMGLDFNDEVVPAYMKDALANVTLTDDTVTKEYNEFMGSPKLRKAIASLYSMLINRELDPEREVIVTASGTEGLFSTIRGLTASVGDEWIIIEPFYTAFYRQVKYANAVPRFTTLKPSKTSGDVSAADWHLDREEMRSLVNSKTRGILFNNPNNPVGKNYERSDLEFIAQLAQEYDLLVISDEVHEFGTDPMIRMATIPGMFERTVTIGSASKAFGLPGWRAGWAYGAAELIERVRKVHAYVIGFAAAPVQEALAVIFEKEVKDFGTPHAFLAKNLASVKRQRDFIVQAFCDAGMQPIVPQGGYCMLAGWPELQKKSNVLGLSNFADWMSTNIFIEAFDAGNYYSEKHRHLGANQLRFCYHKSMETLEIAAKNLLQLKKY